MTCELRGASDPIAGAEIRSAPLDPRRVVVTVLDPDGAAERQAIVELGRREEHARAGRPPAELGPDREIADIILAGLKEPRYPGDPAWEAAGRLLAGVSVPEPRSRSPSSPSSPSSPREIANCVTPPRNRNAFLGPGGGTGAWWRGTIAATERASELVRSPGPLPEGLDLGEELLAEHWSPRMGRSPRPVVGGLATGAEPAPWAAGRREADRLARGLYRAQQPRQRRCRRMPLGHAIAIHRHTEESGGRDRLSWSGLETCSSVWSCPHCARLIRTRRAQDVGALVTWAGDGARMVTLTISHGYGDDLRALRSRLGRAWSALLRGDPWRRFRERCKILGYVRAVETTHGPNGWHPHLHAIICGEPGWPSLPMPDGGTAGEWLARRWQAMVQRCVGPEHTPDLVNGCHVSPCKPGKGGYLIKMGLEITIDWQKTGKLKRQRTSRGPWQIASDYCTDRAERDRALWRDYAAAMLGARMLTWSRDLRRLAGLGDEPDETELADDRGIELAQVHAGDWAWLRQPSAVFEPSAPSWAVLALELGERDGAPALADWIARMRARLHPPGMDPRTPRGSPL